MGHEPAQAWTPPLAPPAPLRVAYARRPAPLRAVIVDDDPAGRERLRRLLEAADVEIAGAGTTGDDAIAMAGSLMPDVLFAAVRDPQANAAAAIAALPEERRPALVVIAERQDFAFQAFETQAIDYLLTPFTDERFARSLRRARRLLGGPAERPATPPPAAPVAPPGARRLIVKTPGQLTFVPLGEIDWVESAGNYVRVHSGREVHLTRESMKSIEARLDGRFVRVHRGAIVNADRIRRIANDDAGHPWVILKDGTQISAGRYIEGTLREWMNSAC